MAELPRPDGFEAATRWIRPQDVTQYVACGPDADRHVAAVRKYVEAGFDHIIVIPVGPDQDGFLRFWEEELRPKLKRL